MYGFFKNEISKRAGTTKLQVPRTARAKTCNQKHISKTFKQESNAHLIKDKINKFKPLFKV
jgi:hypothetical protein